MFVEKKREVCKSFDFENKNRFSRILNRVILAKRTTDVIDEKADS